ncbi:hypothetical protein NEOLEDRAFT_1140426 [Neolentinus lepideus HHB14362 ss-1]|uniref:Transcription factor TFIIIC triple barrel domain-containing protein n=1 Tax=Neolentinus lepideus HHB14362 ss-1 TaxID=1314782 RepID=A0A165P9F3_9AGAM|nr:hypothetical protein NEOLEDRAFT_1140426 [Neolentinus lepideus HHB14362 ss-1]
MSNSNNDSLFPGYRQVDIFEPDEEYEDEEEVSYVTLDMGSIDPTLVPSISSYRFIGLDTPTPFVQLGGSIFKGHHNDLLGTEMLFTDDDEPGQRGVRYVGSSERRICFKEVQLKPREVSEDPDHEQASSTAPPQRVVKSAIAKPKGRPGRRPKAKHKNVEKGVSSFNLTPELQPKERDAQRGEDEAMDVDES